MPPDQPPQPANERQPIAPATRRRLQQSFEHATRNSNKGDFNYANDMFTQCVVGDPGNLIYLQSFLGNLQKKYNNNKKGGKLAGMKGVGAKASIKKAAARKEWAAVIKSGCEILALNPWDTTALLAMARASEALGHDECQLFYLKTALDTDPKDAEVNRLAGLALESMGQFDQAIACWHRVQQAKPGDSEAQRMMANLTVKKTIEKGGYEDKVAEDTDAEDQGPTTSVAHAAPQLTPQQRLEKEIARHPEEVPKYLELADLHVQADRLDEAEAVLTKAMEVSGGGDLKIREKLEDVLLQRGRRQLAVAEKRVASERTEETVSLLKRVKGDVNRAELDIFTARCQRTPGNPALSFELAVRLKRAGQMNEAIRSFQAARADAKRKAQVLIELGECFQHIKQYKLAMTNYSEAVEACSDREPETKKMALYRAGVLAMGLKEWETAEKHLSELAGIDFGFKDVADRLDKLGRLRDKG